MECMTSAEIFATTIFAVKLMHHCSYFNRFDNNAICLSYGKAKSWHLFGTLLVGLSFPFLFMPCPMSSTSQQLGYFSTLAVLFQLGWAIVQARLTFVRLSKTA